MPKQTRPKTEKGDMSSPKEPEEEWKREFQKQMLWEAVHCESCLKVIQLFIQDVHDDAYMKGYRDRDKNPGCVITLTEKQNIEYAKSQGAREALEKIGIEFYENIHREIAESIQNTLNPGYKDGIIAGKTMFLSILQSNLKEK